MTDPNRPDHEHRRFALWYAPPLSPEAAAEMVRRYRSRHYTVAGYWSRPAQWPADVIVAPPRIYRRGVS